MKSPDKSTRSNCDWERVEIDYRAGVLSIREIGRIHDISDTAIRKRAKEYGWERDLSAKVNEKVRSELVRSEFADANQKTEQAIIEEAAATVVTVVRSHRGRIKQGNDLVELLTKQLIDVAGRRDEFEADIEVETADDKNQKRYARLMRAVSLGTHAAIAANLAVATKTWIGLERQAFNIPDAAEPNSSYDMPDDQRRARLAELEAKLKCR
jgi:hypothetical protein